MPAQFAGSPAGVRAAGPNNPVGRAIQIKGPYFRYGSFSFRPTGKRRYRESIPF